MCIYTHTHVYRLHGKCYIFGDSLTMTCFLIIILNVFSKPYETYKYKEYISRNLTHVLNKIFISHFSISSSWTLIDPSINEPFSELTTAFFQTDQPHVKLILSSHGTCHTAQYEPALPIRNNINQMNWSHQRELYSCMYGATKGNIWLGLAYWQSVVQFYHR